MALLEMDNHFCNINHKCYPLPIWNYSYYFNSTCKTLPQKYGGIYLCCSVRQRSYGLI